MITAKNIHKYQQMSILSKNVENVKNCQETTTNFKKYTQFPKTSKMLPECPKYPQMSINLHNNP